MNSTSCSVILKNKSIDDTNELPYDQHIFSNDEQKAQEGDKNYPYQIVQIQEQQFCETIALLNNTGVSLMNSSAYGTCDYASKACHYFESSLDTINEAQLRMMSSPMLTMTKNQNSNTVSFIVQESCSKGENTTRNIIDRKHKSAEYDEGINTILCQPIIMFCDNLIGSIHRIKATVLFNLALLYLRSDVYDKSMSLLAQALDLAAHSNQHSGFPCMHNKNELITASTLSDRDGLVKTDAVLHIIGYIQFQTGLYEDALSSYNRALQIEKRKYFTQHRTSQCMLELAATLNCLGVVHFYLPEQITTYNSNDNATKSIQFYNESLSLLWAVHGKDYESKEIATIFNNLGRSQYKKKCFENALESYKKSLFIRVKLLGTDHIDVAATEYNLGQTYHQCGSNSQAIELYEESITVVKKNLGMVHHDVAVMLKCVGLLHHEQKNFNQAVTVFKEAITVAKAALGENHPEVISLLYNLGNLMYEKGDLEGAIHAYQEELEVQRAVFAKQDDPFHPNLAITLTNLGEIHKLRRDYSIALIMHNEAMQIRRAKFGDSHPSIARNLSSIALIHYLTGNLSKSFALYQEVLCIRRDAHGDGHLDVASTWNSLGTVLFKMELFEEALASFINALRVRRQLLGPEHREVALVLYNIATIYAEIGNDDDALLYYHETLRVERATVGQNHNDALLTLMQIGLVHQQRGEPDEALQFFDEIILLGNHGNSNTSTANKYCDIIAKTLNHIGNVHLQQGQTAAMVDAFSAALRYLSVGGKDASHLKISGLDFYGLSRLHPRCAPVA